MSDTKTLSPTKSISVDVPSITTHANPRDALSHELKEQFETKIKLTLSEIKASPTLVQEARELMEQRLTRITMLTHNVISDTNLKKDVEQIILTTVEYLKHEASKEQEEHKEKEHGEHIGRHAEQKPEAVKDMEKAYKKDEKTFNKTLPTSPTATAVPISATALNLKKGGINESLPPKPTAPKRKPLRSKIVDILIRRSKDVEKKQKKQTIPAVTAFTTPLVPKPDKKSIASDRALTHTKISQAIAQKAGQAIDQKANEETLFFPHPKGAKPESIWRDTSVPKITLKPVPTIFETPMNAINLAPEDDINDRGLAVVGNPDTEEEVNERHYYSMPINTGGDIIENYQETSETPLPGQARPQKQEQENQAASAHAKRKKEHAMIDKLQNKLEQEGAEFIIKQGAMGVARTLLPYILIAIAIIYLLLVVVRIIEQQSEEEQQHQADQNSVPVTINKTGPTTGSIGQNLPYTITVAYPGSAQNVQIVDNFPSNVKYISSSPAGVYDQTAGTVTWDANTLKMPLTSPIAITVSITLQALANNVFVVDKATVNVIGGSGGGSTGGTIANGYVPPTTNNCASKYTFNTPLGKNFGDPTCNFTKAELSQLIKTQDPTQLYNWYNIIIPHESSPPYNPNSYAPPSTGTPDAAGAWGLYQMGSSKPPGQAPPAAGNNGQYDRGDVNWEEQTSNAINYNNGLIKKNCIFWYWSTARNAGIAHPC